MNDERGQSALEFAFAAPFLLAFILFIADMGLLFFSVVSVTNAVREGARCGAVGGTESAVQARVDEAATGIVTLDGPTDVDRDPDAKIGDDIKVTADYTYDWLLPVGLIPGLDLDNISYSRSATMRLESDEQDIPVCGS